MDRQTNQTRRVFAWPPGAQDERAKALAALRQEIPDFDARVEKERARASVKVDAAKDPHARPGNANARKEENAVAIGNPVLPKTKGSHKAETIIARLKRDAATDTHAAALLGSIEAPSIRARGRGVGSKFGTRYEFPYPPRAWARQFRIGKFA